MKTPPDQAGKGMILLVNPLVHDFSYFHLWAQPLFLYSLAGHLRRAGYGAEVLDVLEAIESGRASRRDRQAGTGPVRKTVRPRPLPLADVPRRYFQYGLPEEEITRRLAALPRPRLILVSGLMTYWYPGLRRTVELLQQRWPDAPIAIGGKYVQMLPEHAAATPGIAGVVQGRDFAQVSAELADWLQDEEVAGAEPLPPLPPLDFFQGKTAAALFLGRGCPRRCPYCLYSGRPAPVRRYPPAAVADWILAAAERQHIRQFAFLDDALLYQWPEGLGAVLERVLTVRDDLAFHCPNGLSVAAVDAQLAALLARANFRTLRFGVEAIDPQRQAALGGKWQGEALSHCLARLSEAGIGHAALGMYLLVGLPGQGRKEIEAAVDYFLQRGIRPHLAEYSPLPGSALWPQAQAASPYPLADEPLTHNKTLMPCRAADYGLAEHEALKEKIRCCFKTPRAASLKVVRTSVAC